MSTPSRANGHPGAFSPRVPPVVDYMHHTTSPCSYLGIGVNMSKQQNAPAVTGAERR